jgi:hypothetical protein
MACNDLDAALQLLADRAQYITGASGAAIALRRGEHADMLCRASSGSNAPELGALLSMEYGLSGASVRTRQAMRCDDAERDPRVNREGCRELGIASVVVMPIVSEGQALGVFELFSGKPHAFCERDLSALRRLSAMVQTAVQYAVTAHATAAVETAPVVSKSTGQIVSVEAVPQPDATKPIEEPAIQPAEIRAAAGPLAIERVIDQPVIDERVIDQPVTEEPLIDDAVIAGAAMVAATASTERRPLNPPVNNVPLQSVLAPQSETLPVTTKPDPASKKQLFWSAVAAQAQGSVAPADEAVKTISVPPMLRNLQKCQACGFPVSQGRAFCVECEEKKWRGQRLPQTSIPEGQPVAKSEIAAPATNAAGLHLPYPPPSTPQTEKLSVEKSPTPPPSDPVIATPQNVTLPPASPHTISESILPVAPVSEVSTLFLNSALQSESWFAANQYILAALLVVAIVIGAIAWLH